MPKKDTGTVNARAAMRVVAVDAYLAFIEWPYFLISRLQELEKHLQVTAQQPSVTNPDSEKASVLVAADQPQISVISLPEPSVKAPDVVVGGAEPVGAQGRERPASAAVQKTIQMPTKPVIPPGKAEAVVSKTDESVTAIVPAKSSHEPVTSEDVVLNFLDSFNAEEVNKS